MNYDLLIYYSVISTLGENLLAAKEMFDQSTSIGDLSQVEEVLHISSDNITSIRRFLPRNIIKRGIFNIGGSALKYLFGNATVLDLKALHTTVEVLHKRQNAVEHSLDGQFTYFR